MPAGQARQRYLAGLKLSGHKTESISRRYAIASEEDLAEAVCKVAALSAGGASAAHPQGQA